MASHSALEDSRPISEESAGVSPSLNAHWPKYFIGKVYTYAIDSRVDPERPEWRICGELCSGRAPEEVTLENTCLSLNDSVKSGKALGRERRVIYLRPEGVTMASLHTWKNVTDRSLAYPHVTLSDGRTIRPHLVAVDYDPQDARDEPCTGKASATAQFFHRLPDGSSTPRTDGTPHQDPALPPPPKPFLMVKDRILVHTDHNQLQFKFEVIGDDTTAADHAGTRPLGAPALAASSVPTAFSLATASVPRTQIQYLRDAATSVLYVWSGGFSDPETNITFLEHFVPDHWGSTQPDMVSTSEHWPPSYWDQSEPSVY